MNIKKRCKYIISYRNFTTIPPSLADLDVRCEHGLPHLACREKSSPIFSRRRKKRLESLFLLYFLQISSQFGSIHLLISLDLSSGLCILESTMMSTATKTTATSSSAGDPLKSQSLSAASHQKTAKAKSDDPKPKQPLSAYNIYL